MSPDERSVRVSSPLAPRRRGAATTTVLALALLWGLASMPSLAGSRGAVGQAQQPPAPSAEAAATRPGAQVPEPAQDAQQPVFRVGINFVRVDVIVTDRQGNPVTDLSQDDFEVYEEGRLQTVETFRLVRVTGQPEPGGERPREIRTAFDEENEAAREDTRIFVFFLDDYHVRLGSSLGVREPLVRFIRNNLGPLDLVGVMYPLTPVSLLTLTRNHEAVIREIQRFEGRKFDYRPRNRFEEQYSMYPAEVVERIRNQVSLSALQGLAVRLGGLREGRKAIVLVSEGYTNYLPPQLRDPIAEMPGIGNPNRRRPLVGDGSAAEERRQFFDSAEMMSDLREVYNAANRHNTAIYTLDPRGLAAFEYGIDEGVGPRLDRQVLQATTDTLRILADETDGRAIINRNDLEAGLRQIVRDSSAYYLLGYNSTLTQNDGKFRSIRVRVKRPGVQVRARKGYWALTAEESARALAPPKPAPERGVTEALATAEVPRRARFVRTWVGTEPGRDGLTRVTFVWEPVAAQPGDARREAASRVALVAAGRDGRAYFRGRVPEDPAAGTPSASGGTRHAVEFEAPPGRLQLRVAVEGAGGEAIDSDLVDLDLPDYTAPQVALTTPEVLRARTAIEYRQLSGEPDAIPVADREFRRTERLLIRFSALGPGETQPETTVRLLNRAGQPMTTLQVQPMPGAPAGRWQVDLPLAGLPSGEYVVEVKSTAGEAEAKQFVGFRVVS